MSSIPETTSLAEKRSFFFRTSSIQKIKCSATYPFRIAGIKLSKNAIIELLETIFTKARIVSQRAFLNLYIVFFKLVGTLFSLWVGASANSLLTEKTCDKSQSAELKSFHERLAEKLIKLQKHKSRLEGKKDNYTHTEPNLKPTVQKDSKRVKFESEIAELRSNNVTQTQTKLNLTNTMKKYCLILFVHVSIVFMYLQFIILAVALNTTKIPSGLVFLIASLIFIGIMVFKVFFIEKFRVVKMKSTPNDVSSGNSSKGHEKDSLASDRQSRHRLKRVVPVIDFTSKTLSKIKLL